MTAPTHDESPARALLARVARTYMAPHWRGLLVSALCAAGVAVTIFYLTRILEPAVDALLVDHDPRALWLFPLIIAGLGLARGVFLAIQLRIVNRIGHSVVGEMQLDLFSRLVNADLYRLQGAHSGSFVSSILYDASLVRDASTHVAVNYLQQVLIALASFIVMATIDWGLAAIALIGAPLSIHVIRKFAKRTRRAATGAMSETSALSTVILEGLDGIKIVKIEGREDYERERVAQVVRRRQHFLIKGSNSKAIAAPITEALMTILIAAILAYAGWRAREGGMTPGALMSFLLALVAASQAIRQLAGMQTILSEATTAARRLFEAMDIEPTVHDREGAIDLPEGPSSIRFDDASFAYGLDAPALDGVSLEAHRGETVALVGPSGGGKSTILNLIPRFYDLTGGSLTIDGVDVRSVTLRSLRDRIALVTQEPFLFDDTVRANIAYARPDAIDDEIEAAAKAAAAHDFIMALPEGYATVTGEAGTRLSGGQRQRIAIARAFLKDAPILLLDEATSALDTESEAQVQAALDRLMSGRTTIMIAHRLSTVRGADRIYVIEGGRVVQSGAHQDLMRRRGLYSRLATAQNLDMRPESTG
jgi:ATP-binding cassette, subfamily B, bacterial MsbA